MKFEDFSGRHWTWRLQATWVTRPTLLQILEARFDLANHALFCGETPARHKDARDLQRAIQLLQALNTKLKGQI